MPRFNFNEIALSGKADVSKIQENFEEIEANGITEAEVDAKLSGYETSFTDETSFGKLSIALIRRGKLVHIFAKWAITPGDHTSDSYSFYINLPAWAKPNSIYNVAQDNHSGRLFFQYYDAEHQSNALIFPHTGDDVMWFRFETAAVNQYRYDVVANFCYFIDDSNE